MDLELSNHDLIMTTLLKPSTAATLLPKSLSTLEDVEIEEEDSIPSPHENWLKSRREERTQKYSKNMSVYLETRQDLLSRNKRYRVLEDYNFQRSTLYTHFSRVYFIILVVPIILLSILKHSLKLVDLFFDPVNFAKFQRKPLMESEPYWREKNSDGRKTYLEKKEEEFKGYNFFKRLKYLFVFFSKKVAVSVYMFLKHLIYFASSSITNNTLTLMLGVTGVFIIYLQLKKIYFYFYIGFYISSIVLWWLRSSKQDYFKTMVSMLFYKIDCVYFLTFFPFVGVNIKCCNPVTNLPEKNKYFLLKKKDLINSDPDIVFELFERVKNPIQEYIPDDTSFYISVEPKVFGFLFKKKVYRLHLLFNESMEMLRVMVKVYDFFETKEGKVENVEMYCKDDVNINCDRDGYIKCFYWASSFYKGANMICEGVSSISHSLDLEQTIKSVINDELVSCELKEEGWILGAQDAIKSLKVKIGGKALNSILTHNLIFFDGSPNLQAIMESFKVVSNFREMSTKIKTYKSDLCEILKKENFILPVRPYKRVSRAYRIFENKSSEEIKNGEAIFLEKLIEVELAEEKSRERFIESLQKGNEVTENPDKNQSDCIENEVAPEPSTENEVDKEDIAYLTNTDGNIVEFENIKGIEDVNISALGSFGEKLCLPKETKVFDLLNFFTPLWAYKFTQRNSYDSESREREFLERVKNFPPNLKRKEFAGMRERLREEFEEEDRILKMTTTVINPEFYEAVRLNFKCMQFLKNNPKVAILNEIDKFTVSKNILEISRITVRNHIKDKIREGGEKLKHTLFSESEKKKKNQEEKAQISHDNSATISKIEKIGNSYSRLKKKQQGKRSKEQKRSAGRFQKIKYGISEMIYFMISCLKGTKRVFTKKQKILGMDSSTIGMKKTWLMSNKKNNRKRGGKTEGEFVSLERKEEKEINENKRSLEMTKRSEYNPRNLSTKGGQSLSSLATSKYQQIESDISTFRDRYNRHGFLSAKKKKPWIEFMEKLTYTVVDNHFEEEKQEMIKYLI